VEVYAQRSEIRRRILARLGYQTDDSQGPLISDRINENIRAGAMEVYRRQAEWTNAQRETRVSVGIDQRFINYPTGATAGNIMAVGVWTGTQYVPLRRARITLAHDDEPLVDIGEPDSVGGRGQPTIYECKAQIEIWPRPDETYELKIDHTVNPDLQNDSDTSVVDAEAIILYVLGEVAEYEQRGTGQIYFNRMEARLNSLRAMESTRQTFSRSDFVKLRKNGHKVRGDLPNSGQWPSVMPS
jgi:hypothetical protein